MKTHLPRGGLAVLFLAIASTVVLFIVLNSAFGGPQVTLSSGYQVKAVFEDTQGMLKKSFVLARGVEVGSVERIDVHGDRAVITFSVQKRYAPIYRDATVRTGNRTLLGEPYLDLDPGTASAGTLRSGATLPARQVLPTVEFDEGLKALEPRTLANLRTVVTSFGDGFTAPNAADDLNDGWAGVASTVHELRRLTDTLDGQGDEIAGVVHNTSVVLAQLGDREHAVRRLVGDGRDTLTALATRRRALRDTLGELPGVLSQGRRTLQRAEPVLRAARPLIADVREAAPDLAPTFRALEPVARDAVTVVDRLPSFNAAAVPALRTARPVLDDLGPLADRLKPALRNLIPTLRYLAPRANAVTSLFSNLGEFANHGDARGLFLRYQAFVAPGITEGTAALEGKTYVKNPYPGPSWNTKPGGFTGTYPRLMPYAPGEDR